MIACSRHESRLFLSCISLARCSLHHHMGLKVECAGLHLPCTFSLVPYIKIVTLTSQSMQHESLTLSAAPPFREMLSLHANISIEQISQIRQESKTDHEFSVFWVPRRTLVSDRILEENGVLGEVTIGECPLFLIPLESDLLSLELEDAFSDLYLVGVLC